MNENAARRKLNKKLDSLARDGEGGVGRARNFHKATRMYGKALVDAALEEMEVEEKEAMDSCVFCGVPCKSFACSKKCEDEYDMLVNPQEPDYPGVDEYDDRYNDPEIDY